MRMLVGHTASVHAWVADIVENRLQARPHRRQLDEFPDDFDNVAADYDESLTRLLTALGGSRGDDLVWNWFDRAPAPAGFWFRRMAQETVIHRVDAELGARSLSPIDPSLAADGIGEFLGLLKGYITREPVEGIRGSIAFSASDAEGEWRLALAPDRIEFIAGEVDATVRGPASDLYRWVMHRDDGGVSTLALSGDRNVIEAWRGVKFE